MKVANFYHGAKTIFDLWKNGQVVSKELAQNRADTCLAKRGKSFHCPHNSSKYKPIESAAKFFKAEIERKNRIGLVVKGERRLHVCDICWCDLKIKIHVPIKKLIEETNPKTLEQFREKADYCWILNESNGKNLKT